MNDKILILTPGFPENEQDSTCVPYIQHYVIALAKKIGNENVVVVSLQYPFTRTPYTWNGIQVFPSGGKNNKSPFAYYLNLRRTRKRISQLYKTAHFCVHAFWMGEAAFLGRYIAKKNISRFVVTFMGQDVNQGNRVMRFIDYSKTCIVTLCRFHDETFFANYGHQADAIIPMPIKDHKYQITNERTIDILFVGSFIAVKQPLQFVEIIAKLKNNYPTINAVMIGEGNLMEEVKMEISKLQLDNNIRLLGQVSQDVVFDTMTKAKILLHTSKFEGQCLVYAEALSQGMNVVSYPVGWFDSSEKHITGKSVEELTERVQQLLSQSLRFQEEKVINTDHIVEAYLKLYKGGENNA